MDALLLNLGPTDPAGHLPRRHVGVLGIDTLVGQMETEASVWNRPRVRQCFCGRLEFQEARNRANFYGAAFRARKVVGRGVAK